MIVPDLPRVARRGMKGPDVYAHKAALANAGYGRGLVWSPRFGYGLEHAVNRWRGRHGFPKTGRVDERMFNVLRANHRYGPFAAHQLYLARKRLEPTPRAKIVAASMFSYNVRGSIHYTQGPSRMYGVRHRVRPPAIPYFEDCSSFATWLYWVAGLPDPNGFGYNGLGYTGTLIMHGHQVSSGFMVGDLVFYGYGLGGVPSHVAIYVGDGRVVSHGAESGPLLLPIGYRTRRYVRRYF